MRGGCPLLASGSPLVFFMFPGGLICFEGFYQSYISLTGFLLLSGFKKVVVRFREGQKGEIRAVLVCTCVCE